MEKVVLLMVGADHPQGASIRMPMVTLPQVHEDQDRMVVLMEVAVVLLPVALVMDSGVMVNMFQVLRT